MGTWICRGLHKSYGQHVVLRGVDWELDAGAMWGLIGDSGAGKTTLLRLLAGLETPDRGAIVWSDPHEGSTEQRGAGVGMVFQDVGLWPHLSVRRHLECVMPRGDRRRAAEQLLQEVELLPDTWERTPDSLSGGEAQRLGLARALAVEPSLVLLDEPFSQLDAGSRARLHDLLKGVARNRQITLVLVTHSWLDTNRLCDRVAVLSDGVIAQAGTSGDIFRRPASATVARLSGPVCQVPRAWVRNGRVRLMNDNASGWCCVEDPRLDCLVVRPQQFQFVQSSGPDGWCVANCEPQAFGWTVLLSSGDERWELIAASPEPVGTRVDVAVTSESRV